MKKNISQFSLIAITGCLLFSACGKSSSPNLATQTGLNTPVTTATATIQNFTFSPAITNGLFKFSLYFFTG